MLRSPIRARLASAGAATLLLTGLFGQVAPVAAASPARVLPAGWSAGIQAATHRSPRTVNVRTLLGQSKAAVPFDATAASAALGSMEAKDRAARVKAAPGSKVSPSSVTPPPDPVTSSGAPAPTTPVAVAGQTEPSTGTIEPANPGIAVGPDEVVQADNTNLNFTDRTGSSVTSVTMPFFFGLPEPTNPIPAPFTTFDSFPQIHFDTLRQRWIVSELSWDCAQNTYVGDTAVFGHGYIDYAISDTSDPLGSWSFDFFGYNDFLPDRPAFGTSTDKFALTMDFFHLGAGGSSSTPGCTSGAFVQGQVNIEDWSQLGPGFDSTKIVYRAFGDSQVREGRLAVQDPVTSPDLRIVNPNTVVIGDVDYSYFTGSAKANTLSSNGSDLTASGIVPGFGAAQAPLQLGGGTLTTAIDSSPDSVVFHNGTLAFTANYQCTPTGDSATRNCVRVITLGNAVASAPLTRLGDTLIGTNTFDDSFGGIGWSGNGALHVVYTRSSATSAASSYESYNLPTDTSSAWSTPHVLTAGTATYTGAQWGGGPTVATDPQDSNAVWVGDPYANGSGKWSTRIHQIVVGGAGAGYFPITPVRVLNSRDGTGMPGGVAALFTANVPLTFPVGGTHGIPTGAVAITGNLTVTGQTAAGYISLTPTATVNPSSSTLNFPLGDTRANNVTISLAADGSLAAVYKAVAGKHTNVILDVTGYFLIGSGQDYFTMTPTRILNSRPIPGPVVGAPTFHANIPQAFQVQGFMGIPGDATAITANLTVTGQTKAGYVSLTPTLDPNPLTSTINVPLGDTRANGLTIQVNPIDGKVSAVYKAVSGTADLILDVTGYYRNVSGGLLFHPLSPGRVIDTRQVLGAAGLNNQLHGAQGTTPRSAVVGGHLAVPAGAAAITGNLTVTAQTGPGFVAVTDASVANPLTSTINFPLGDTRANGITAPLGAGDLWFDYQPRAGKTVQMILDITGYFQ